MEFDEIADKAFKGTGCDKLWNLPKKYAYLQLEQLYFKYRKGYETKENCIIEKSKIKKEYEWNEEEYNRHMEMFKAYNDNRIKNETLIIEIEKAKSKEDIIKPALQIIQNCVADDNFVYRITEKLLGM